MKRVLLFWMFSFMIIALILPGCAKKKAFPDPAMPAQMEASAGESGYLMTSGSGDVARYRTVSSSQVKSSGNPMATSLKPVGRQIIYRGDIRMVVENIEETLEEIHPGYSMDAIIRWRSP